MQATASPAAPSPGKRQPDKKRTCLSRLLQELQELQHAVQHRRRLFPLPSCRRDTRPASFKTTHHLSCPVSGPCVSIDIIISETLGTRAAALHCPNLLYSTLLDCAPEPAGAACCTSTPPDAAVHVSIAPGLTTSASHHATTVVGCARCPHYIPASPERHPPIPPSFPRLRARKQGLPTLSTSPALPGPLELYPV